MRGESAAPTARALSRKKILIDRVAIGMVSYAGPSRQLSVEELPSDLNPCPLQPNLSTKSSALIDQVTQFDV